MIHFKVSYEQPKIKGRLVYRSYDWAFDFEFASQKELNRLRGSEGVTSISIGSLQVDVSIEKRTALYVWGYHPRAVWKEEHILVSPYMPGSVRVISDQPLLRGVAVSLAEIGAWPTVYSSDSGWLCIGRTDVPATSEWVEFATSTVAVIQNGELLSIWLHPEIT